MAKQRTSALALCESLMHSKRPERIGSCWLESTRSDTGAFLLPAALFPFRTHRQRTAFEGAQRRTKACESPIHSSS